jgi:tetraacyldisaccharide 4'-kinase
MKQSILAAWERMAWGEAGWSGAAVSALLLPASWAYGLFVRAYLGMYEIGILRRMVPDCAVVSVGNLTVGGSGKTPVAIALARAMRDAGRRPCIVSYGYGVDLAGRVACASDGEGSRSSWRDVGDEAAMIADLLPDVPVLAARRRVAAISEAVQRYAADVVILDDGFQYWRVKKDCEIVAMSGRRGFGNGRVFPAGPLREWGRALGRADLVVWSGGGDPDSVPIVRRWGQRNAGRLVRGGVIAAGIVDVCDGAIADTRTLDGRRVFAVSGIGDPGGFERLIEEMGGRIVGRRRYPDHYPYRQTDIEDVLCEAAESQTEVVVTTDKDRIKLDPAWLAAPAGFVKALRVEFRFDGAATMPAILARIPEPVGR